MSLGEGGLMRRLEALCHLTRPTRQILTAVALPWLPVVLLGKLNEHQLGYRIALLHDPAMHVRLLIATPVLLVLDYVFPKTCRYALAQLLRHGVIPRATRPRFEATMRSARRLGDWWLPEILLIVGALAISIASVLELVPLARLRAGRSEAQIWYALVALPLFEFLLLRSLWRWLIWVYVVVSLARMELDLEPTHPDRRGGIAFLRLPSLSYASLLLFAMSSVLCAELNNRFSSATTVMGFAPMLLSFALIATLVAFGPLLLFVPKLARAKRDGLANLGSTAAGAGRWFRDRWQDPADADVVTTNYIQSMASVVTTYRETVAQLHLILFEKYDLILVLAAALGPVLPVMMVRIPPEDWRALLGLFTGGLT
ncbi:MAG: hypothetical protein SFX73_18360 [Kofleriaceae bacterium]|nr:hypothetical protein [Kofleriaceae bacterium]